MIRQEEKQQLLAELAASQQQNASFEHKVSSLSRELAHFRQNKFSHTSTEGLEKKLKLSQKEVDSLQKQLSMEREKCCELEGKERCVKSELEECRRSLGVVSQELTEMKV